MNFTNGSPSSINNFDQLRRMNFDDNERPRHAIEQDRDDQRLEPREHLAITSNDVLCGRGKTSFNHVGNRRFRHIISESIDDYNSAGSRKAKSAVVKRVHDQIRATGGRFLKMEQRAWVELSQQRSLEKVSHAIRDATSTNENMKKKKQQVNSTIAEVAAHVSSRFPGVQLEHKLDDTDEEVLAFKSIEDIGFPFAMPPLQGSSTMASAPMPTLTKPTAAPSPEQAGSRPVYPTVASLPMPGRDFAGGGRLERHQQQHYDQHQLLPHLPQLPPNSPREAQEAQGKQPSPHDHDDDFVSYINDVLGPVSPDDLNTDPLKKLSSKDIPKKQGQER